MAEQKIQVPLRLDRELHGRVRRASAQRHRSINNLITTVLSDWLDEHEDQDKEQDMS